MAFWEEGASKAVTAEMGGGAGGRRGQLAGFQLLRGPRGGRVVWGDAAKNKPTGGRSIGVASYFPTLAAVGGVQAWMVLAVSESLSTQHA